MEWQTTSSVGAYAAARLTDRDRSPRGEPAGHRPLDDQAAAALQSRMVIGQAAGILMQRDGLTSEQAFALLVDHSQRSNTKLREIAQRLVDQVDGQNR